MTTRRKRIAILAVVCLSASLLTTTASASAGSKWGTDQGPVIRVVSKTAGAASAGEGTTLIPEGKAMNVAVGQRFAVRLESNAGTGYEWTYQTSGGGAAELAKTNSTAATVPGGKVITTWVFVAKTAGNVRLDFSLARPWEKDSASATARFEVNIGGDSGEKPASDAETAQDTVLAPNTIARVAVGDRFIVRLEANAGTGYAWSYAAEGSAEATCAALTSNAARPGAKETTTWFFTATKPGELKLTFSLARPWESRAPIQEAVYTVEVR